MEEASYNYFAAHVNVNLPIGFWVILA